jgi:hypothetical protein
MRFQAIGRTVLAAALTVAGPAALAVAGQEPLPPPVEEGYQIVVPEGWHKVEYKDGAAVSRVEYVYKDRSNALLKIKRVRPSSGEGPAQISERELETVLRFTPGFVRGKSEDFAGGKLAGMMVQYEFSRGGKPMLGRSYYLRGTDAAVWVLHFTGERTSLSQLRAVTDRMARDFAPK